MASNDRTSAPRQVPASRALREAPLPQAQPAPSCAELTVAFAQALDLAEGREPGHAARVGYIALRLADGIGLAGEERRTVFYAALLHDAGAGPASAETCRLLNLSEEALFGPRAARPPQQVGMEIAPSNATRIVEVLRAHLERGARVTRDLGFGPAVQKAIAAHHERWDGLGYPRAQKGQSVPVTGRLVAAADLMESLISAEPSPLTARRNLAGAVAEHVGTALEPKIGELASELARSDAFWLGLHHDTLLRELGGFDSSADDEDRLPGDLRAFARVFAALADAKGEHTGRHAERTAEVADGLAASLGLDPERRELVRVAALVHNVGLLGVPARVIAKPDILSLSEMETMRKHPTYSQMVVEALPSLGELARWVGAHHERPDGKGYPEMLEEEGIALEARIIALADTYVALTSPRPYRRALSHEDALQVLLGGAGTQLDRKLVQVFCMRGGELTSSRTVRRLRQRR